ncbi:MAG: hypothetical protein ABIZ49_06540 [Opitutaceae bacterium]
MKSFLQGKKNIEVAALRPPGHAAMDKLAHPHGPHSQLSGAAPGASNAHVEVIKEGGKVVRLIVTCVCGERVEIDCLYSAGT